MSKRLYHNKHLGELHEQVLPQPSSGCALHKDHKDTWRTTASEINFFKFFFRSVTPTSFLPHFSIVLWLIGHVKTVRRITNTSIKVYFWIVTAFTVATRIVSSCLDYFKMNDTLFTFYDDASDETRIDKTLQKSQVLVERLGMIFRVSFC